MDYFTQSYLPFKIMLPNDEIKLNISNKPPSSDQISNNQFPNCFQDQQMQLLMSEDDRPYQSFSSIKQNNFTISNYLTPKTTQLNTVSSSDIQNSEKRCSIQKKTKISEDQFYAQEEQIDLNNFNQQQLQSIYDCNNSYQMNQFNDQSAALYSFYEQNVVAEPLQSLDVFKHQTFDYLKQYDLLQEKGIYKESYLPIKEQNEQNQGSLNCLSKNLFASSSTHSKKPDKNQNSDLSSFHKVNDSTRIQFSNSVSGQSLNKFTTNSQGSQRYSNFNQQQYNNNRNKYHLQEFIQYQNENVIDYSTERYDTDIKLSQKQEDKQIKCKKNKQSKCIPSFNSYQKVKQEILDDIQNHIKYLEEYFKELFKTEEGQNKDTLTMDDSMKVKYFIKHLNQFEDYYDEFVLPIRAKCRVFYEQYEQHFQKSSQKKDQNNQSENNTKHQCICNELYVNLSGLLNHIKSLQFPDLTPNKRANEIGYTWIYQIDISDKKGRNSGKSKMDEKYKIDQHLQDQQSTYQLHKPKRCLYFTK